MNIKDKILDLKTQVNALREYDEVAVKKITDILLIYIKKSLPEDYEIWCRTINMIQYLPSAVYLGFSGFAASKDHGEFENAKKRLCDIIDNVVNEIDLEEEVNNQLESSTSCDNNNVFVVHGHNDAIRELVARTITTLGLKPIILHEQSNNSNTIIEKLEANSNVGYAVILLTPCDEGREKGETQFKNRARQNVIAEMGYFIGKLGRNRVSIFYKDDVEIPSDFLGITYTILDSSDGWKIKLARDLKAAGYQVKVDNLI